MRTPGARVVPSLLLILVLCPRPSSAAAAAQVPTAFAGPTRSRSGGIRSRAIGGGGGGGSSSDVRVIDAAIDVLEEAERRGGAPMDAVLRTYRFREDANVDRESVRSAVSSVARHQMRLDWHLRRVGVPPTPEARVVADAAMSGPDGSDLLAERYPWLSELGRVSLDDGRMNEATLLEVPGWAYDKLAASFSASLADEMRALQHPAPLDLRVNLLKCPSRDEALHAIRAGGFRADPTPYSPVGIRLHRGRVALGKIPGLLDGVVEPQDEGSQVVASLLDAKPGEAVVDYCAGSGGKTMQLSASMRNGGRLIAMDVDGRRLERAAARFGKAGVTNVQRHTLEPFDGKQQSRVDPWCKRRKRTFDGVLVDAPCSGVGSWRRKPDARRTWCQVDGGGGFVEDVQEGEGGGDPFSSLASGSDEAGAARLEALLPLQAEILWRAARLVRPGGRLVYATCSLLPDENERQVERFLASDEGETVGWRLVGGAEIGLPYPLPFESDVCSAGEVLRLTPHRHGTDGFFGAVLTLSPDAAPTKRGLRRGRR